MLRGAAVAGRGRALAGRLRLAGLPGASPSVLAAAAWPPPMRPTPCGLAATQLRFCSTSTATDASAVESPAKAEEEKRQADADEDDDEVDLILDHDDLLAGIHSSMKKDAAAEAAERASSAVIAKLLPPSAPKAAFDKLRAHFAERPINGMVHGDRVTITHIQGADGRDERAPAVGFKELTLDEALEKAMDANMDLVKFGAKTDNKTHQETIFCRLRFEKVAALREVVPLLPPEMVRALEDSKIIERSEESEKAAADSAAAADFVLQDMVTHSFRDRVDAHFIGWRSKKIVADLKRRRPVRLTVEEFANPTTAVRKMREMLVAIEENAKEVAAPHFYTGVNGTAKDVTVHLQPTPPKPSAKETAVKHPSPEDWKRALTKMNDALGISSDGTGQPTGGKKGSGGKGGGKSRRR